MIQKTPIFLLMQLSMVLVCVVLFTVSLLLGNVHRECTVFIVSCGCQGDTNQSLDLCYWDLKTVILLPCFENYPVKQRKPRTSGLTHDGPQSDNTNVWIDKQNYSCRFLIQVTSCWCAILKPLLCRALCLFAHSNHPVFSITS